MKHNRYDSLCWDRDMYVLWSKICLCLYGYWTLNIKKTMRRLGSSYSLAKYSYSFHECTSDPVSGSVPTSIITVGKYTRRRLETIWCITNYMHFVQLMIYNVFESNWRWLKVHYQSFPVLFVLFGRTYYPDYWRIHSINYFHSLFDFLFGVLMISNG